MKISDKLKETLSELRYSNHMVQVDGQYRLIGPVLEDILQEVIRLETLQEYQESKLKEQNNIL